MTSTILLGNCVKVLRTLPEQSVDAVITDPPYAEVDRSYGRFSESDWHQLMDAVVPEVRRVLKPAGSAVFILQPSCESVGRVRPWLWEFMAKWSRNWNMVQDMWWWNPAAAPTVHCQQRFGLTRPSVKPCVWLGAPDCYRNQAEVLWAEADSTKAKRAVVRAQGRNKRPSGQSFDAATWTKAIEVKGGVTPYNLLPIANTNSQTSGGAKGHGAATPADLCRWWLRYITKPGDVVLDPFVGSGTVAAEALKMGRSAIGIEQDATFVEVARQAVASVRMS
jgi:DNA modification methylase